jgi:hypothetical protein
VRACVEAGWAEPWFDSPGAPWRVHRLTAAGAAAVEPVGVQPRFTGAPESGRADAQHAPASSR